VKSFTHTVTGKLIYMKFMF